MGLTTPTVGLCVIPLHFFEVSDDGGGCEIFCGDIADGVVCGTRSEDRGDSTGLLTSSVTGELRGFVVFGEVYLLFGGVLLVNFGAEIPFTASTGFESCK